MAHLEEYKSLNEKSEIFDGPAKVICGPVETLFDELEELQSSESYLFRGMNNAKYKLYNSAQREFLRREIFSFKEGDNAQETYTKWMDELVTEVKAWNSNTIENFFVSLGIDKDKDLAYLSFMQHQGLPTPLLDFTANPFVALFFAIDKVDYDVSNANIESCVSLYYINKKAELNKIFHIDHEPQIRRTLINKNYKSFANNNVIKIIEDTTLIYRLRNNMNIVNQEGCFIYNWNATNPLEESYQRYVKILQKGSRKDKVLENEGDKMICMNIHKSIIPKMKEELERRKGINSTFIYPNFSNQREKLIDKSIFNLLK